MRLVLRSRRWVAGLFLTAVGVAGGLGISAPAGADVLITNHAVPPFVSTVNTFAANTLGFRFTVGASPIEVTALGFWDHESNGLPSAMLVGLWRTSNASQLAAVTVPAGAAGTLVNDYRYVTLPTPVTLLANTSYTLGYRSAQGGQFNDGRFLTNYTLASAVAIPTGGFGLRHSFDSQPLSTDFATQMPLNNLGDTAPLTGPNLQFTVVPEPATVLLATACLLAFRRHR